MSVKRQLRAVALAFAVLSIAVSAHAAPPAAGGASTELPPPPLMLVVDTEKVMAESKAMKSLKNQAQDQAKALQREFQKRGDDLRATQAALKKELAGTSNQPDASLQERMRTWEKTAYETQREATSKNQALEQGADQAKQKVKEALDGVVREIAHERGANMVVMAFPLMIFDSAYDVTADAQRRLDVKLPNISLVVPKPVPPQAGVDPNAFAAAPPPSLTPAPSTGKKK